MYQTFYISFSDWDYFYAGEILGNEYFRIEMVSLFSTCQMFNFSVTVIKKLLKELATFFWSFNFSSFTSKVRTCSTQRNSPVSFFVMFHVVFVIIFCCNSLWVICSHYAYSTLQHHTFLYDAYTKYNSYKKCLHKFGWMFPDACVTDKNLKGYGKKL